MKNEEGAFITTEQAVLLGAKNLITFGRLFFPKTFRQSSPDFHFEMGNALYGEDRFLSIEVFRDGAKTTLTRTFLAQRIAYGISRTILVLSASQSHAILTLRWLKRAVEHNSLYAGTFRLRKGSKWSDDYIEIVNETLDITVTVIALGITGQLRGFNVDDFRPDLILCDDTSTDEVADSDAQREKQEDTVFGALRNSLAPATECPQAKMLVIDTPKHTDDLIATCKKDPSFRSLTFGIFDKDGKSRWESRYPTAQLLKDKANEIVMGRLVRWMKEKECKIISSELLSFRLEHLDFWEQPLPRLQTVIVIDPAISDSKEADENVIGVLGFKGEKCYLLDYHAATGQDPEMVWTKVQEFVRTWKTREVVVETVAYQKVLAWYLERKMVEARIFLTIHKLIDKRRKPDRIIQEVGDAVAVGNLACRKTHVKFLEQYQNFSPKLKGLVDVIDMVALGLTWAKGVGFSEWFEDDEDVLDVEEQQERYRALRVRGAP